MRGLSRWVALGGVALGVLATIASGIFAWTRLKKRQKKIIVVGSGVSGLAAAQELKKRYKCEVLVLEARRIIGGRLDTDRSFVPGIAVEIGAEFVHGGATLLEHILRKRNIPRRSLFVWSQGDGGPLEKPAVDGGIAYYYLGDEERLYRSDAQDEDLLALHHALHNMESKIQCKTMSVMQYLQDAEVPERVLGLAEAGYANTQGSSLDQLSTKALEHFERCWEKDGEEGDFRLPGGMDQVVDALQEGLHIQTNRVVKSITVCDKGVEVACADGSTYGGTKALVTVPITVLQREAITFYPPLSDARKKAISSFKMAAGCKVHLLFSGPVAPSDCHGMVAANEFLPEFWFHSPEGIGGVCVNAGNFAPQCVPPHLMWARDVGHCEGHYLVTGFAMGDNATKVFDLPEEVVLQRAVDQLDRMFAMGATAKFVKGRVVSWKDVPHVWGAYTTPWVGELPNARKVLAAPHHNAVYFAGEATSGAYEELDSPVTIHGAMATGVRAAVEIAMELGLEKRRSLVEATAQAMNLEAVAEPITTISRNSINDETEIGQ